MMPNLNPAQMQKMMKQLGMKTDEIDATRVEIHKTDGSVITIAEPNVVHMSIQGQESFQITGNVIDGDATVEIDPDDLNMVVEQAGVSPEDAEKALIEAQGDLAKAILDLKEE